MATPSPRLDFPHLAIARCRCTRLRRQGAAVTMRAPWRAGSARCRRDEEPGTRGGEVEPGLERPVPLGLDLDLVCAVGDRRPLSRRVAYRSTSSRRSWTSASMRRGVNPCAIRLPGGCGRTLTRTPRTPRCRGARAACSRLELGRQFDVLQWESDLLARARRRSTRYAPRICPSWCHAWPPAARPAGGGGEARRPQRVRRQPVGRRRFRPRRRGRWSSSPAGGSGWVVMCQPRP